MCICLEFLRVWLIHSRSCYKMQQISGLFSLSSRKRGHAPSSCLIGKRISQRYASCFLIFRVFLHVVLDSVKLHGFYV